MRTDTRAVWAFEAIGAPWTVETDDTLADDVRDDIRALIDAFDREWSRFRADSLVARLASAAGTVAAPEDAEIMLDAYVALDAATSGAVNPLVGDALARLGYDARYSFAAEEPHAAPADWRTKVRWDDGMLTLDTPATIDIGALGKGRLVDRVADLLAGVVGGSFVVDASGDMLSRGREERVALEHPYDPTRAIGVWSVRDRALCASAINRRAWGDGLHHVLDARTGVPVRAYAATWAVADTAMRADALATALFFDGGPELAAEWDAPWVRMRTDGAVEWSLDAAGPDSTLEVFR